MLGEFRGAVSHLRATCDAPAMCSPSRPVGNRTRLSTPSAMFTSSVQTNFSGET